MPVEESSVVFKVEKGKEPAVPLLHLCQHQPISRINATTPAANRKTPLSHPKAFVYEQRLT
jgi:hypothetical protein